MIHTIKGFGVINKAEVDVFLEFSCFFDDPMDIGNLISGSFAFLNCEFLLCEHRTHAQTHVLHMALPPGIQVSGGQAYLIFSGRSQPLLNMGHTVDSQ